MERHRAERRTLALRATPDRDRGSGALSAREVAALLGLHERTVRRAIRDGRLVAAKHGRAFIVTPEALNQYRSTLGEPDRAASPATRPHLTLLPARGAPSTDEGLRFAKPG